MSIKDITNYVRQTPGNTNPNVVRSMVEAQVGEYVDEAVNEALRKLGINEGTSFVEVVPKTALEQWTDGSDGPTVAMIPEMFEVGGIYRVETDSGVFTGVCRRETVDGTEMHVIGNAAFTGAVNSGESFGAATLIYGTETTALLYDYNKGTSMTVSKQTETITPIKDDYLPMDTIAEATMKKLGIQEEKSKNVYFQEQTFVCDEDGYYELSFYPEVGRTYTVLVNGTEYKTKAIIATIEGEDICLGNIGRFGLGFEDTGEPWAILHYPGESFSLFVWIDGTEKEVTLSVYEETETITPIDSKYLPNGGEPIILNLNNYKAGGASLTFALFYLFYMGGGNGSDTLDTAFWDAVNTQKSLVFLLDLAPYAGSIGGLTQKIYVHTVNRIFEDDNVVMLDFSVMVFYGDKVYKMEVAMNRSSNSKTLITLRRTQIS